MLSVPKQVLLYLLPDRANISNFCHVVRHKQGSLSSIRQTQAMAYRYFMAFISCWFHRRETAGPTQFIDLRTDVKVFTISTGWSNNEEEKERRTFGVCTKENVFLTQAMMYTLDWPNSLKFSTHFKGDDTIAVEFRLFFTITVQWAQTALFRLAGSLLRDRRCSSGIARERLPWPSHHIQNQKYLW